MKQFPIKLSIEGATNMTGHYDQISDALGRAAYDANNRRYGCVRTNVRILGQGLTWHTQILQLVANVQSATGRNAIWDEADMGMFLRNYMVVMACMYDRAKTIRIDRATGLNASQFPKVCFYSGPGDFTEAPAQHNNDAIEKVAYTQFMADVIEDYRKAANVLRSYIKLQEMDEVLEYIFGEWFTYYPPSEDKQQFSLIGHTATPDLVVYDPDEEEYVQWTPKYINTTEDDASPQWSMLEMVVAFMASFPDQPALYRDLLFYKGGATFGNYWVDYIDVSKVPAYSVSPDKVKQLNNAFMRKPTTIIYNPGRTNSPKPADAEAILYRSDAIYTEGWDGNVAMRGNAVFSPARMLSYEDSMSDVMSTFLFSDIIGGSGTTYSNSMIHQFRTDQLFYIDHLSIFSMRNNPTENQSACVSIFIGPNEGNNTTIGANTDYEAVLAATVRVMNSFMLENLTPADVNGVDNLGSLVISGVSEITPGEGPTRLIDRRIIRQFHYKLAIELLSFKSIGRAAERYGGKPNKNAKENFKKKAAKAELHK